MVVLSIKDIVCCKRKWFFFLLVSWITVCFLLIFLLGYVVRECLKREGMPNSQARSLFLIIHSSVWKRFWPPPFGSWVGWGHLRSGVQERDLEPRAVLSRVQHTRWWLAGPEQDEPKCWAKTSQDTIADRSHLIFVFSVNAAIKWM